MLDEEDIAPSDRIRLLILYIIYRDGILPADLDKLLAHAQLGSQEKTIVSNLELVGTRTTRGLKDKRPAPPPLFERKPPPPPSQDEYLLSRYEPALQRLLEAHAQGNLDSTVFPYTRPPLDLGNEVAQQSAASLRSAKPTWARTRTGPGTAENRQRVIVLMAGGATYSESRVCYDVGRATGREVFLVTSHMLTPSLFLRQLGDLSADRRRLGIPAEQPKPQVPRHLLEPDEPVRPPQPPQHSSLPPLPTQQQQQQQQPPTQQMAGMNLNGRPNGGAPGQGQQQQLPPAPPPASSSGKLTKDPDKKKRHHFGFGKKS